MIEFIRHSGMHHLYASTLQLLESATSGASTDLQLTLFPSISIEIVDLLGEGTSTPPSALVEFIAHRQMIAINHVYSLLCNQPALVSGSPTPPPSPPSNHCTGAFTCSLKLITINLRSMLDSGKVKLPADFDLPRLDGFHIATLPAAPTRGGLMIAVRENPEIAFVQEKRIGLRVLVLIITISGRRCRLLCLHAPTAETPLPEHRAFAVDVALAVSDLLPGETMMIGSDLNARLGGLCDIFSCVGTQPVSTCPQHAEFRHDCLHTLSSVGMIAANTVLSEPTHTTWKHPSGSEQQIDFIWVASEAVHRGELISCKVGPWSFFDCNTTSDHRHVEVVILFQAQGARRGTKRACPHVKIVDEVHLANYQLEMVTALPAWNADTPPATYLQEAMRIATETVRSTAPARAPQRKSWISPEAWSQMSTLNLWRRFLTAVRRQDHLQMQNLHQRLGSPKIDMACVRQCASDLCVCTPRERMEAAAASTVKGLQATLKRSLRACRKRWFSDLCSTVDGHRDAN
eukprot:5428114-Amphidinium_carterae.3